MQNESIVWSWKVRLQKPFKSTSFAITEDNVKCAPKHFDCLWNEEIMSAFEHPPTQFFLVLEDPTSCIYMPRCATIFRTHTLYIELSFATKGRAHRLRHRIFLPLKLMQRWLSRWSSLKCLIDGLVARAMAKWKQKHCIFVHERTCSHTICCVSPVCHGVVDESTVTFAMCVSSGKQYPLWEAWCFLLILSLGQLLKSSTCYQFNWNGETIVWKIAVSL